MTYHIDLLLENERRHATPPLVRALFRGFVLLAVTVVLAITVLLMHESRRAHTQLIDAQKRWQDLKPRYEDLQRVRASLQELRAAKRQLDNCGDTRLPWGQELADLQRAVPAEVQLTELTVSQFVGSPTSSVKTARIYTLRLSGKVGGDEADAHVKDLMAHVSSETATGRVESVAVPPGGFRQDTDRGAGRSDRVFELICRYRPRIFK